jgi:hypothetical protein
VVVTSWEGEFPRRAPPPTSDGSGGRRQCMLGMAPFKGEGGWRYRELMLGLGK